MIEKFNEFSVYVKALCDKNAEEYWNENDTPAVYMAVSRKYHNNPKKEETYHFYSERANDLVQVEYEEDNEDGKVQPLDYVGRAKQLDAKKENITWDCVNPFHKILFVGDNLHFANDNLHTVMCTLRLSVDGSLSLGTLKPYSVTQKAAIGNVYDADSIFQMIKRWNYAHPLSCKEAEELGLSQCWKETNCNDACFLDNEKVPMEELDGTIEKYKIIEELRIELHKKYKYLSWQEIEDISKEVIELKIKGINVFQQLVYEAGIALMNQQRRKIELEKISNI